MNKNELKLAYMGTPQFSADILQGIIDDGYNVVAVITEPDKPVGRKQILTAPPVKILAEKLGLPVYQPEKKVNVQEALEEIKPDIAVVVAYGKILTAETIEVPKYGILNFHASLLPRWRGASPVQAAILAGDKKTGVTIMKIDAGMDTGDMLARVEVEIDSNDTTKSLLDKMVECGLPLFSDTIIKFVNGEVEPRKQGEEGVTTCTRIQKEDGQIDFNNSAEIEERKVRAYHEWPNAWAIWGEKRIKFLEVDANPRGSRSLPTGQAGSGSVADRGATSAGANRNSAPKEVVHPASLDERLQKEGIPGTVFLNDDNDLCVQFSDGCWIVKKLQLEGKNAMLALDFLNGNKGIVNDILR